VLIQRAEAEDKFDDIDFDWPKHHAKKHIIDDIWQAGATPNFSTRVGEGVHQEIREEYAQTNRKNVEGQVLSWKTSCNITSDATFRLLKPIQTKK
jgi:hypothetical protein